MGQITAAFLSLLSDFSVFFANNIVSQLSLA